MNYRGRSLQKTLTWTHTTTKTHTHTRLSGEEQQRGPRSRNHPGCVWRLWLWRSSPPISPAAVCRSCPQNPHDSTVCGLVQRYFHGVKIDSLVRECRPTALDFEARCGSLSPVVGFTSLKVHLFSLTAKQFEGKVLTEQCPKIPTKAKR